MGTQRDWIQKYLDAVQGLEGTMRSDDTAARQEESVVVVVEDSLEQLEKKLGIPSQIRSEFNFLKFPFFDLAKDPKREEIKIQETQGTPDGEFRILWHVTRDVKSHFPGEFEKRLHRAIEQIINTKPKPIAELLELGSLRYIARVMGVNESGENTNRIQQAFKNIVRTSVEAKGTFQLKESKTKKYINDVFHLYDRVIFQGEQLPDGRVADCVYLVRGTWYRQNINNNYVIPLDWHFYTQLAGSVTTRMYEYFGIQFFIAQEQKRDYCDVFYKRICDYFPLVLQDKGWKARKQLKEAHEILIKAKYFERIEWLDTRTQNPEQWVIRYWIGSKARTEYERNKTQLRELTTRSQPVPIPERRRRQKQLEPGKEGSAALNGQNSLLERELVDEWGLTAATVQKLLKTQSEARIREVISWARWAKTNKSKLVGQNVAGWIRKALEERWTKPPAGFVSDAEKQILREKELKVEADKEAAKEREWQWWLQQTPEERVRPLLELWITKEEKLRNRIISRDDILAKERELIEREPNAKVKQMQIFGEIRHPGKV